MIKRLLKLTIFIVIVTPLFPIAIAAAAFEGVVIIPLYYIITGKWIYLEYKSCLERLMILAYKLVKEKQK